MTETRPSRLITQVWFEVVPVIGFETFIFGVEITALTVVTPGRMSRSILTCYSCLLRRRFNPDRGGMGDPDLDVLCATSQQRSVNVSRGRPLERGSN